MKSLNLKKTLAGILTLATLTSGSPFVCSNAKADDPAALISAGAAALLFGMALGKKHKNENTALTVPNQQAFAILATGNKTNNPILAQAIAERKQKLIASRGEEAVKRMSNDQIISATMGN